MSERIVSALWQRFKDIYGQKWTSLFQGAEAIESWRITWGGGIRGFTDEQLRHGVGKLASAYPEWPPTLGQFRELCWIPPKPCIALPRAVRGSDPFLAEKIAGMIERGKKGPWRWTPDKVVNAAQVQHIVDSAKRGYPPGVEFLAACQRAGVITADGRLNREAA